MNPTFMELMLLTIGSVLSLGAHILVIRYTYRMKQRRDDEKIISTIGFLATRVDTLSQEFYRSRESLTNLRVEVSRMKGRMNFKGWRTGE